MNRKTDVIKRNLQSRPNVLQVIFTILILTLVVPFAILPQASAAKFTLLVQERVYTPGETLVIYGAGAPDDILLVRLYDPSGKTVPTFGILRVVTDSEGFFKQSVYVWPDPTVAVPLGTYTIEAVSSKLTVDTRRIEVTFTEEVQTGGGPRIPTPHTLGLKMDSPAEVAVGKQFRIFIQVTFDGALVSAQDSEIQDLLGTSHIHSGNTTILLRDKLKRLHEGLYFADVTLDTEGTYIIHAEAFYRGLLSHDSKVITATTSSIGTIQESVSELDLRLNSTNRELQALQNGIQDTKRSLNDTQSAITQSVEDARSTIRSEIDDMRQASGQINALILPVLALISVIIALQISLFARIRASYR